MKPRLYFGLLALIFWALFISACSKGVDEAENKSKTNSAPLTAIVPNQQFISNTRQVFFQCRDVDPNDACRATYFHLGESPSENIGDQFLSSFTFENVTPTPANAGTVTVYYFSIDSFGNKESEKQKTYQFDLTAPLSQNINVTVPPGNYQQTQWINFNCADEKLDVSTDGSGCSLIYLAVVELGLPAPNMEAFRAQPYPGAAVQINTDSTLYFFAEDAAGNKSVLNHADYTFNSAVANISALTAKSGDGRVDLSWILPTPIGNIQGVKLIRNENRYPQNVTDGTEIFSSLANSYSDTNLINGHNYFYGVFAFSNTVPEEYSLGQTVSATPNQYQPPPEVRAFTATANDGEVSLAWQLPLNLDRFSHVEITRDIGTWPLTHNDGANVFSSEADPTAVGFIDKPLTNGLVYYYRIFVVDSVGNYSDGVPAFAKALNARPGSLVNLNAVAFDGYVDLNWGNPGDADLASVHIRRKLDSAPSSVTDGVAVTACSTTINTTTCRDDGVTNGLTYYYAGFTQDLSGQYSDLSVVGPVSPKDMTPPGDVKALSTSVGSATVVLTWTNPNDLDFVGVKIYRSSNGFNFINDPTLDPPITGDSSISVFTVNKDSATFSDNTGNGLQTGITYYYSVFAVDSAGNFSVNPATATAQPLIDNIAPEITATTPMANMVGVNPLATVNIDFSKPIAAASLAGNFSLFTPKNGIQGTPAISPNGATGAVFTPDATSLPLLTQITAKATTGIKDLSGNALNTKQASADLPYEWSFTTADGVWNNFTTISDNRDWTFSSTVALDSKGNGMAVFFRNNGTAAAPGELEIVAKHFTPSGGWGSENEFVNCYSVDPGNPASCLALQAGGNLEMAMDAAGNSVVVWQSGTKVYANRYRVGGAGWSLPINLHVGGNAINSVTPPKIVIDPQGMVTIAWSEQSQASLGYVLDIWATRFSVHVSENLWNDQLSVPEKIEWNDEGDAQDVELAVDKLGNVMAIWNKVNGSNIRNAAYNYFHQQAGGLFAWDQPSALPSPGQLNTHPHADISNNSITNTFYNNNIAVDPETGNAMALWCHPDAGSTTAVLWADFFNAQNATWSGPVSISDPAAGNFTPRCSTADENVRLAMGYDGRAIALWITTGFSAQVNRFVPGSGQWEGAQTLFSADARMSKIVMDPQGHSLAMLTLLSGEVHIHRIVRDIVWDASGLNQIAIRQVVAFPAASSVANRPALAVSPQGTALSVWTHDAQSGTASSPIHSYSLRSSYFGYIP